MRTKFLRAFRNSYLAALLICTTATAQLKPVTGPGQKFEGLRTTKALWVPYDNRDYNITGEPDSMRIAYAERKLWLKTDTGWALVGKDLDTTSLSNRINAKVDTTRWKDSLAVQDLQMVLRKGNIGDRELILDNGLSRLRFRNTAAGNIINSYATGMSNYMPLMIGVGGTRISDRSTTLPADDDSSSLIVRGHSTFLSTVTVSPATQDVHAVQLKQLKDSIAILSRTGFPISVGVDSPALKKDDLFFGNSITFGWGLTTESRFPTLVSSWLNGTEWNYGLPGSTMMKRAPLNPFGADNMVDRIGDIPSKTSLSEYLFFAYGVNDLRINVPAYDTANFKADYRTVLNAAFSKGWTAADIVLITPTWFSPEIYKQDSVTFGFSSAVTVTRHEQFVHAVLDLATEYGLKGIDIYTPMKVYGSLQYMQADGIHPNGKGHKFIADVIIEALKYNVKNGGQAIAANGLTEVSELRIKNTAIPELGYYSVIGIDTSGRVVAFNRDEVIINNIGTPQYASTNIYGDAIAGSVTANNLPKVTSGQKTRMAFGNGIGYIYAIDETASTGLPLIVNHTGGRVGIRNSNPVYDIDATGSFRADAILSSGSLEGQNGLTITGLTRFHKSSLGNSSVPDMYYYNTSSTADLELYFDATTTFLGPYANTDLVFVRNNGMETMRIEASGVKITGTLQLGSVKWITGSGSPEGSVTAPAGSLYSNTSGGAGTTFYVKESGSGNTGWIAK